eukprot:6544859-Alexandrium_andersonii.AAC.1
MDSWLFLCACVCELCGDHVFVVYQVAAISACYPATIVADHLPFENVLNFEDITTAALRQPTPRCLSGHGCTWRKAVL